MEHKICGHKYFRRVMLGEGFIAPDCIDEETDRLMESIHRSVRGYNPASTVTSSTVLSNIAEVIRKRLDDMLIDQSGVVLDIDLGPTNEDVDRYRIDVTLRVNFNPCVARVYTCATIMSVYSHDDGVDSVEIEFFPGMANYEVEYIKKVTTTI